MTERQATEKKTTPASNAGFDGRDLVLLTVMRRFLLAYADPSKPYWETAMDFSVASFGHAWGPGMAYSIMDVLRKMREARRTVFAFMSPCCASCAAKTTDCERLLLQTISSMRRGDHARARMDALILCEGHDTDRFLAAVSRLVAKPALNPLPG